MKTENVIDLEDQNFQSLIKRTARKATQLCGRTKDGKPLGPVVSAYLSALAISMDAEKESKEAISLVMKARNGDKDAISELRGIRLDTFNNYLLASQNIIGFFYDIVDLAEDEKPYAKNETKQDIRVAYVGGDGQPNTSRIIKPHNEERIPLRWLTTDEVEYFLTDIYNGRVSESAKATIDLGYNMRNKMEETAWTLLHRSVATGGAFGDFAFTGSKVTWPFVISGRTKLANLPTGNSIVVPGTGAGTKFRYQVFQQVKKYAEQWGSMFRDGPLVPTGRLLVPSSEASDIAEQIAPTGSTNNKVADELLETGWAVVQIHGQTYTIIADETLSPGACYAEYNRKAGTFYTKSGLDQEIMDDSKEMLKRNKESRFMRKAVGAYINSSRRMNVARFIYNDAYSAANP
jgi:hypothetical protein